MRLAAIVGISLSVSDFHNVPYSLPVELPEPRTSPPEDAAAPYTPIVLSLISQLEASQPPTPEQITNATRLLYTQEGLNGTCHNLANVVSAVQTVPRIMPLCFSNGLFIAPFTGPNQGKTTGMSSLLLLSSSFDLKLANAVGQAEGREGRNLMVTGLLGPQADTDIFINWFRGHQTPGEDPLLNGQVTAAEVNGIQGQGLMSQVKHFAGHNGTANERLIQIQDQAFHELLLPPYEAALMEGGSASVMCAYNIVQNLAPNLNQTVDSLASPSPYPDAPARTWPLNEAHYACENPFLLSYTLRNLWGYKGFVGSDYPAIHSTSGLLQGADREDSTDRFFGLTNPHRDRDRDPLSSTCANTTGEPLDCAAPGASHVAGIPGKGCPAKGCGLVDAVIHGLIPLSVFNQALARVLYQEERFGLLGCDNGSAACPNPGGIDGDRSGTAPLKAGPTTGRPALGTKNGDAAIVERVAEEGGVLLKNNSHALPITDSDLRGKIAVSGAGAEYLIGNPNDEGSPGFPDRNAVSPLEQLETLSGNPSAFAFTPAGSPTGIAIPCSVLSKASIMGPRPGAPPAATCGANSGLQRSSGLTSNTLLPEKVDRNIEFTTTSAAGQLSGGRLYRWEGWIYIPREDNYVLRVQHSNSLEEGKITFSIDGDVKTLIPATSFYHGQYYGKKSVDVSTTNAGYVEKGLINLQCAVNDESTQGLQQALMHGCAQKLSIGWHKTSLALDATDLSSDSKTSLRFAMSRTQGDIRDAAANAKGKAMAIVFVNDRGRRVTSSHEFVPEVPISSLPTEQIDLIDAVASVNPNTVVVLNTGTPIVLNEWLDNRNVKALLNMWHSGQEGGTSTARLLLGQANPSGHTPMTWPLNGNDTIEGYDQPRGLYDGDTPGKHPERLNGLPGASSRQTEGIYAGYRFYDRLDIPVQFPFGFGLSYTTFAFSNPHTEWLQDASLQVTFDIKNTGSVAGAEVTQLYVGPGPEVKGVQQAVRSLRGFERVELNPGEKRRVLITLDRRSFQYWSEEQQRWILNPGQRSVFIGDANSLKHLPLVIEVTARTSN